MLRHQRRLSETQIGDVLLKLDDVVPCEVPLSLRCFLHDAQLAALYDADAPTASTYELVAASLWRQ